MLCCVLVQLSRVGWWNLLRGCSLMTVIKSIAERLNEAVLLLEKARQTVLEARQRLHHDERDLERANDSLTKCKGTFDTINAEFVKSLEDNG